MACVLLNEKRPKRRGYVRGGTGRYRASVSAIGHGSWATFASTVLRWVNHARHDHDPTCLRKTKYTKVYDRNAAFSPKRPVLRSAAKVVSILFAV